MLDQIRDICSGCDTLQLIQNKKYYLCSDCVFKKNHGGKGKQEVYKERHDKKEVKKKEQPVKEEKETVIERLKKTFSIKKISSKRTNIEKQLKETYKQIDNEREQICEGCGRGDRPLSHSHILSRYFRPDLICELDNIRLHCFGDSDTCHTKWERAIPIEVVYMLDFKENLEYIKEVDIKAYNKIIANFEFHGVKI